MNRLKWTPKLWLGLLSFIILVLVFHPESQWRGKVLAMKLSGRLAMLTWDEVLAGLAPEDRNPWLTLRISELVTGDVRFKSYEDCDCPVLWDTPIGSFWGRFDDGYMLEVLISEQVRQDIYLNDVVNFHPGDVVLDVGGHIGVFTRVALQRGAGLVVAFEPDPSNIACFRRNFNRELSERKIILIEAAAMEKEGQVPFEVAPGGNTAASRVAESGRLVVKAVTIDDTLARLGLEKVHFIKMDIEGSERHALAGAGRTLKRHSPRMAICIYHRLDDPTVVPRVVLDLQPSYQVKRTGTQAYFF